MLSTGRGGMGWDGHASASVLVAAGTELGRPVLRPENESSDSPRRAAKAMDPDPAARYSFPNVTPTITADGVRHAFGLVVRDLVRRSEV